MSSKDKINENNLEAKASIKSLKTSAQKVNLVLQTIRGLNDEKAIHIIEFSRRRIADDVKKILKSAISNAENNHQLDIDKLYVKEATVGRSMVMKRFRPRARGRSGKILKPYSKVRIVVREHPLKEEKAEVKKNVKEEANAEVNKNTKDAKKTGENK